MPSIVTKALTEAAVLFASHTLAPKTFAGFWKSVSPRLAEGVGYIDKHQNEGLEADKTFLEIITFRDAKIERIVNGCLKEFLHSDVLALIESTLCDTQPPVLSQSEIPEDVLDAFFIKWLGLPV